MSSASRQGPAARLEGLPWLTASVALLTASVSTLGLLVDPVFLALRRDGAAISAGEAWRLLTALLVQDGGVAGAVFNLAGLVVVGIAAERRLGRRTWVLAYLAGALTGELVGWAGWQPVGGGNSVGVCGLAGALAVAAWRLPTTPGRLEAIAPVTWAAALLSGTLTVLAPIVAACAAQVAVSRQARSAGGIVLALVLGSALLLLAEADIHGTALAAGLVVGALVRPPR